MKTHKVIDDGIVMCVVLTIINLPDKTHFINQNTSCPCLNDWYELMMMLLVTLLQGNLNVLKVSCYGNYNYSVFFRFFYL